MLLFLVLGPAAESKSENLLVKFCHKGERRRCSGKQKRKEKKKKKKKKVRKDGARETITETGKKGRGKERIINRAQACV